MLHFLLGIFQMKCAVVGFRVGIEFGFPFLLIPLLWFNLLIVKQIRFPDLVSVCIVLKESLTGLPAQMTGTHQLS